MKYSDALEVKINPLKSNITCNESISGELLVTNYSKTTILIDGIHLNLILKHQGKGETDERLITRILINNYKAIQPQETITHPFLLNAPYNVTYIGKNVTQNLILKAIVDISKTSEKELRNNAISKLKVGSYLRSVFIPDFYNETLLEVNRGNTNYEIKSAHGFIRPGLVAGILLAIFISVVLLIAGTVSYNQLNEQIEIIYGTIIVLFTTITLIYLYQIKPSMQVGKIQYKLNNIEGNFYEAVMYLKNRNHNLKEINCQLLGIEEVTYNNGSNRNTTTHTFYKSDIYTIKRFGSNIKERIELPNKSLPISIINNDFKIIWQLQLVATTNNKIKLSGSSKINLGYEKD